MKGFVPLFVHNVKFKQLKYIFRNDALHGKAQPRVIFFNENTEIDPSLYNGCGHCHNAKAGYYKL